MKTLTGRQMCKWLARLGWQLDRINGSHHVYRHPSEARRIVVVPVHGNGDLKPGTQREIMRVAGISPNDL